MDSKKSPWGILGNPSKNQIKQYSEMPYGDFTKMVKELEKKSKGKDFGNYKIIFYKKISSIESCEYIIEQTTKKDAEKIATAMLYQLYNNQLSFDFKEIETNNITYQISHLVKV